VATAPRTRTHPQRKLPPGTRSSGTRSLRALGGALAALLTAGSVAVAVPTSAGADGAGLPFDCIVPTFFAQAGSATATQLYKGSYLADGTSSWTELGSSQSGATNYNALAFNPIDEYLYGTVSDGSLVRIDSAGAATVLGASSPALGAAPSSLWDSGEFDAAGTYYVTSGNAGTSTISKIADIAGARTKTSLALGSAVRMADFSFKDGYLWSHTYGAAVPNAFYRINAATGAVTTVPSNLIPAESYGSVFTMNNGNLAFVAANARMYQVAVTDPTGPAPTFSLVSDVAAPTNARSDASNCVSSPADLSVTVDGPASVEPGAAYSWTLTLTNGGPGMASGFVVKTQLPTGATGASVTGAGAACTTSGTLITCNGGAIAVDDQVVLTLSATAPAAPGTATTTTTVTGNELDSGAADNTATLTTTVAAAAPPPAPPPAIALVDDTASTPADTAVDVDVIDNDTVTDPEVSALSTPASGTAELNPDGTVRYAPDDGFSGTDSFTYTVTDSADQDATATVTVTVTPTALDDAVAVVSGGTAPVDVLANDIGTALVVLGAGSPSRGTVEVTATGIEYSAATGYSGSDSFTYTLEDAAGSVSTATVAVTVTPQAVTDTPDTLAGAPITWDPAGNDGGEGLVVTALTDPAHGTATLNLDGTVTYTAAPGYSGPDSFTYTATDADGSTVLGSVTVMVAPLAVGDAVSSESGALTSFDLLGNDSGSGMLITSFTDPAHGDLAVAPEGMASYTPEDGFAGADTFDYTAEDSSGQQTTASVTILITALDPGPVTPEDPEEPADPDFAGLPSNGQPAGRLAATGVEPAPLLALAAMLGFAGAALAAAGRRRLQGRRNASR
jgi:hypothetical protein